MNSELKKTVIIGSGNLAEALARAVAKSELELVQIFRPQRRAGARRCGAGRDRLGDAPRNAPQGCRHLLDRRQRIARVAEVAATLPIPERGCGGPHGRKRAVTAIPERFARRAVFYPMQTFTRGREAGLFRDPRVSRSAVARTASGAGGVRPETLRDGHLGRLGTALQGASRGGFRLQLRQSHVCRGRTYRPRCGADFDVLKPLIAETAAKACDARSPLDVQTGPAVPQRFSPRRPATATCWPSTSD